MTDLRDLLKHEIQDLHSAEEQIIEAMPGMIEKAKNPDLKKALREHLRITEEQKRRLDQVQKIMGDGEEAGKEEENKSLFSRLFGGGTKCKGMEGLIEEGQKVMKEDMNQEVLDAAIIASAQRIEHYEITGYGTARAYARELKMNNVERLLEQTLREEYEADRLLTSMAVGKVNIEAEMSGNEQTPASRSSRSASRKSPASSQRSAAGSRLPASGRSSSRTSASKSSSKSSGRSSSKSAGASKTASKKGASKSSSRTAPPKKSSMKSGSKSGKSGGKQKTSTGSRKRR